MISRAITCRARRGRARGPARRPGRGPPALPTTASRSPADRLEVAGGPRVHAARRSGGPRPPGDAGRLERVGQRRLGQRDVGGLAEPLLPLARRDVARHPPAVEELRGRRAEPERSAMTFVARREERGGAVAALRLVGARRAGRCGRRTCTSSVPSAGGRDRAEPLRTEPMTSTRRRSSRGRARRGSRSRWSCRDTAALVVTNTTSRRPRRGRQRARAASTPIDVGPRRRTRRRACPAGRRAERLADAGAIQPPVRNVGAIGNNAEHESRR